MKIKEVENKEEWEGFLKGFSSKTFLQGWNWGEFQKKMGKRVWRLGVYNNGKLVGACFCYREDAKRGRHLVVPHGPMIKENRGEVFGKIVRRLREIGEKEGVAFVRIAPVWKEGRRNEKMFEDEGFRGAPMHVHAEVSWHVDVDMPEKEILMSMRKNTRYYIRKALKNQEIEVEKGKGLDVFNKLYSETVSRHNFTPFSEEYLENEVRAFEEDDEIVLFTGRLRGEPFVSAIIIFWQGIAFYHHGASLRCDEPVSYGVQWEVIKEAKRRGCSLYNLWGISDIKDKSHPWWGLTLFKRGFGGRAVHYVKTQDLVLSPFYWLNYGVETVRRFKRGF